MANFNSKRIIFLRLIFYFFIFLTTTSLNVIKVACQSTTEKGKFLISNEAGNYRNNNHKNEYILEQLKHEGHQLAEKRGKNKTILINGRKFDQINPIECIDNKFFNLLMNDLNLIDPNKQIDNYGTYYDFEYAKAVGALLDRDITEGFNDNNNTLDENNIYLANNDVDIKRNILHEVSEFWYKTIKQYNSTIKEITSKNSRVINKNYSLLFKDPSKALANYHFLQSRIEQLKIMLLDSEETLIVLNNRVKKLNQAIGENELHSALCSCITSRGGRAALMLMNEIFVDKNSFKVLRDLKLAEKKAKDASMDVAEYCSYWYGDTIRSQAAQKEKLIQRLVLKEAKYRSLQNENNEIQNTTRNEHESRMKIINSLVRMTSLWLPQLARWINGTLNAADKSSTVQTNHQAGKSFERLKRHTMRASDEPKSSFSTPFDLPNNYDNFDNQYSFDYELRLRRKKRRAFDDAISSRFFSKLKTSSSITGDDGIRIEKKSILKQNFSKSKLKHEKLLREPIFEAKVSRKAMQCAKSAFTKLLSIAYDQNALIYGDSIIPKDHPYIETLNDVYSKSFLNYWIEKRDLWSKSFHKINAGSELEKENFNRKQRFPLINSSNKSVDEEIDISFEQSTTSSSYDRGARLGFTVGKFIGEKASMQWPDPAELNTFTYDSIFLAGVAQGHSEEDTRSIEKLIVGETAKRVAFTEANRQAFAKSIHLAYLNGAFVVPNWGVLHAQRSISKRVAKEGGRVGFDAAAKAINDFSLKAKRFFNTHEHQRSLSAPYKLSGNKITSSTHLFNSNIKGSEPVDKSKQLLGLEEQINRVKLESEISVNISREAVECGQKAGTVMGALMGLIITPEAFETYTKSRGSLEALENEFYQFKLGAMRGYELGETWAQLNYTTAIKQNLIESKQKQMMESKQTIHEQNVDNSLELAQNTTDSFESNLLNTNNIFQYMVPNYGYRLLANHSQNSMLKIRTLVMDDNLIEDMKMNAGDLIANISANLTSKNINDNNAFDTDDEKHIVGELKGEFGTIESDKKKPIKLDIIDLGPILEMSDVVVGKSDDKKDSKIKALMETPLTAALSKISKIFMNFSVARKKENLEQKLDSKDDDFLLTKYLNGNYDAGDGYLRGTFSHLSSHLGDNSNQDSHRAALIQDDFGLEVAILDELFDRIEKSPADVEQVNLIENIMRVTTMAPARTE